MADQTKSVWFVWVPGEEAPQMHKSLEAASKQADIVPRMNVGTRIHIYQLESVGSIHYPNTPTIIGDFKR